MHTISFLSRKQVQLIPQSSSELAIQEIERQLERGRQIYTIARNAEQKAWESPETPKALENTRFWSSIRVAAAREQIVLQKRLATLRGVATTTQSLHEAILPDDWPRIPEKLSS